MKGFSITTQNEIKNFDGCKIKYLPGTMVRALKNPAGITNDDFVNSIFIVQYVWYKLEPEDGVSENDPQPTDLPYYQCIHESSRTEAFFTEDELEELSQEQMNCILKYSLLKGYIPLKWEDKYYQLT